MARVRKPQPTLDSILFATPEQKVLRFLLSEPTTVFSPRVISSKLKGVRGLGGIEGINRILKDLAELGMVEFVDNNRGVRLQDDCHSARVLKTLVSICELDGLKKMLEPISNKIILFGSRSNGKARSDSDYDLFVVSEAPEEVRKIARSHPLGKLIEMVVWTPDDFDKIERADAGLNEKLSSGIVIWGTSW